MKSHTVEKNIDSFTARLSDNPQSLAFSRIADQLRKEGNFSKAIEICIKGLQAHPDYVTGRIILGQCYNELGNTQEAIQELLTILSYDRKNQAAIKMLADLYSGQEMIDKASSLYNLLYRMDPSNNTFEQYSKNQSSIGHDIFSILGLTLPNSSHSNYNQSNNSKQLVNDKTEKYSLPEDPVYSEQMQLVTDSFNMDSTIEEISSTGISSEEVGKRIDDLFGAEQTEAIDLGPQGQEIGFESSLSEIIENDEDKPISGEDISERMDMLFGDNQKQHNDQSVKINTIDNSEVEGEPSTQVSDQIDQSDDLSTDATEISENMSDLQISGDDISFRLDSLIGNSNDENQSDLTESLSTEIFPNKNNNDITRDVFSDNIEKQNSNEKRIEETEAQHKYNIELKEDTAFTDNIADESISDEVTIDQTNSATDNETGIYGQALDSIDSTSEIGDENIIEKAGFLSEPINDESEMKFDISDDTRSIQKDIISLKDNKLSEENIYQKINDLKSFGANDNIDFQNSDQSIEIKNDESSYIENLTPISGDDILNQIDNILGKDDKQSENNSNFDTINNDLSIISNEHSTQNIELTKDIGMLDDFIYDKPDTISSQDSQLEKFDLQEAELKDDTISISKEYIISSGDITENNMINGSDFIAHQELISDDTNESIQQGINEIQRSDISNDAKTLQNEIDDESEELITGSDVEERLEAISGDDSYNSMQQESNKKAKDTTISSLNNPDFEETLQFDASMFLKGQTQKEHHSGAENIENNSEQSDQLFEISVNSKNEIINDDTLPITKMDDSSIDKDMGLIIENQEGLTHDTEISSTDDLILGEENSALSNEPSSLVDKVDIEGDEKIISEMDVLISSSSDVQNLTGDDVIERLETIFPSDVTAVLKSESDFDQNQPPMISVNDSFEVDNESTDIDVAAKDLKNGIDEFSSGESPLSTLEQDNASIEKIDEEILNEERLDDLVLEMDDESNVSLPGNMQPFNDMPENTIVKDTNGIENGLAKSSIDDSMENLEDVMPIEDNDKNEFAQLTNEPDNKDKAYSIPDHVLTPTLADIYYQQGQLQQAAHIYTRLLDRDSENTKVKERLEEIQKRIASDEENSNTIDKITIRKADEITRLHEAPKSIRSKRKSADLERPLAGVRIKKAKKSRKSGSN